MKTEHHFLIYLKWASLSLHTLRVRAVLLNLFDSKDPIVHII